MSGKRVIAAVYNETKPKVLKGIVLEESEDLENVYESVQTQLSLEEPVTKIIIKSGHQDVEIANPKFIRDGDEILVVTKNSLNNDEDPEERPFKRRRFDVDGMMAFNIGGELFFIHRESIRKHAKESMLNMMLTYEEEEKMMAGNYDERGALIINRNPEYFGPIFQYLRKGDVFIGFNDNLEAIMNEAQYFAVDGVIKRVKDAMELRKLNEEMELRRENRKLENESTDRKVALEELKLKKLEMRKRLTAKYLTENVTNFLDDV